MAEPYLSDDEFLKKPQRQESPARYLSDDEFLKGEAPKSAVRPAARPGMSYIDRLKRTLGESVDQATRGNAQMFGKDSSAWDRTKGFGNTVLGGLASVYSPADAAVRRFVGNPAEKMAKDLGASPEGQVEAGDWTSILSQILGPSAVGAAVKKAPQIAGAVAKGAAKVGDAGTALVNSAGQAMTKNMEDLPPTAKALKTRAADLYDYAFNAGVKIDADRATQFTSGGNDVLKAKNVITSNAPINEDIYPETKKVLDRMERHYSGRELTLREIDDLRQEMNAYIQKTYAAGTAKATRDTTGVQTLRRYADDLVQSLKADSPDAIKALDEAKELWRRQSKMDTVENIRTVAEKLNTPELLRREFASIVNDPLQYANFSKEEQKLIDQLARKGTLEDIQEVLPPISAVRRGTRAAVKAVTGGQERATVNRLLDMIAGGETQQAKQAAAKAAKPSFSDSIESLLSPNDMRPNKFDPYYAARSSGAYKQTKPSTAARETMEGAREESRARAGLRGNRGR